MKEQYFTANLRSKLTKKGNGMGQRIDLTTGSITGKLIKLAIPIMGVSFIQTAQFDRYDLDREDRE